MLGVLVAVLFPLDPGGEITTLRGRMHLALIVISGILTIAGMVVLWYQLASVAGWSTFATYSLISGIVSLILVAVSAAFINSNYKGLAERFMVSSFQLYYFVLALMVFLMN